MSTILLRLGLNIRSNRITYRASILRWHHRPIHHYQTRNASWFKKSKIIIEEPHPVNIDERLQDVNHFLKSTEIPTTLRRKILHQKLQVFEEIAIDDDNLIVLNNLFLELYKINNYELFDTAIITSITEKSCNYLMQQDEINVPEFLSVIIMSIFQANITVQDDLLVCIIQLSIKTTNISDTLKLLLKSKLEISPSFINALLETIDLNLQVFETIGDLWTVDSNFYNKYIHYIEKLFINPPNVHEYKDLNRSLFRVQELTNKLVNNIKFSDIELDTTIHLLKVLQDLNLANHSLATDASIDSIIQYLESLEVTKFTNIFLRQELGEDLLNDILNILWSKKSTLANDLCLSIIHNNIFYSKERIIQAKLFLNQESFENINLEENIEDLYLKVIQLITLTNKPVDIKKLTKSFNDEGMETPLMAYKLRLDQAIKNQDFDTSLDIFNESISNFVQWSDETNPQVLKTLNDLIRLSCKTQDIEQIFDLFTKVKQQMVNFPVNIHVINELSNKMLQSEFVGDVIEMINRELPDIKKDDVVKLPIEYSFGEPYKELFNILHEFVTSYTNESTFETNWVLYGELHKYFHVPYETYLPTMKFFNDHNRMHSSLVIFRQIKKLNELHGNHNHLPPLKEMYLYLFTEFGDKLYEEGVEEIHEYLKMDVSLPTQDIDLQNSVLNAYSNLQDVAKTRDLFSTMLPLKKIDKGGINEETVQIMIKTYTYSNLDYVISFWNNMSTFGILPNADIFKQYLIAHVYHGFANEAIELIDQMDDYGLEFNEDTLVAMYNFCLNSDKQDIIERWAKSEYKGLWDDAESKGLLKRSDNYAQDNLLASKSESVTTTT